MGQEKGEQFMSYLNSVTIIGFVGADPEQRQARNNNGSKFTVLSVATQRSWKNTSSSGRNGYCESGKSRLSYAIPEHLLRNHPNRPQPRLHQLRPSRDRKLRAPQPKRMPALGVQMHLHWNPSLLQRNVVSQRVVYVVHVVILSLQQKRRRRLAGHRNFGIQRKMFIGIGRMRDHKLLVHCLASHS